MIVYRGTPYRERRLRPAGYECVFFASTFDTAADYAAGEKAVDEKGWGYVAKWDVGRQKLLDADDQKAVAKVFGRPPLQEDQILFFEPTMDWVEAVMAKGYTGTRLGDDLCVFDASDAELLSAWRVELSESGRSWQKRPVA